MNDGAFRAGELLGRREALGEARDVAADYERDAAELLAIARSPDRVSGQERLLVARKIREGIEALDNAPAPLPDPQPRAEVTARIIPIFRRRK